jgi:hypothetical protein
VFRGPEWGRAEDAAVVDGRVVDDVAGLGDTLGVAVGLWCITGARGVDWWRQGGVGGLLGHR